MTGAGDDTIAVRADEALDEAALAAWLRGQGIPGSDGALAVRQFGGGKANITYLLDLGGHEYVLRRPPLGPVAKGAHDMAREHAVLSRLHEAFAPAPRALAFCGDHGVLGADFFVMERRRGVVVRERMPAAYASIDDAAPRMGNALVDTLADLHAVDYAAIGLDGIGRPDGFLERQLDGWHRRWLAARVDEVPTMDAVHAWLVANLPASQRVALVHNDYKLDNVMLAAADPGKVVAVFDWDMCTLGDPLSDLGALLTYWRQPDDPAQFQAMAMMPDDPRFPDRAALVARYAERAGLDVSGIAWYHALGLYRLAVILAQIYVRYHRGQTVDARFKPFGRFAALAGEWAERVTGTRGALRSA